MRHCKHFDWTLRLSGPVLQKILHRNWIPSFLLLPKKQYSLGTLPSSHTWSAAYWIWQLLAKNKYFIWNHIDRGIFVRAECVRCLLGVAGRTKWPLFCALFSPSPSLSFSGLSQSPSSSKLGWVTVSHDLISPINRLPDSKQLWKFWKDWRQHQ